MNPAPTRTRRGTEETGAHAGAPLQLPPHPDPLPHGGEGKKKLGRPVPFQVLDALVELLVGEMEEGAGFTELFLDGLVPDIFGFDVGGQTFG